jgi:hypothetical protein
MPTRDYPFKRYGFYDRQAVAAVLEPDYQFQSQRGSWGISGIVRFGGGPNYVFFVSFGKSQEDHEFDEAVYDNGMVRWQSQPAQKLTDPVIQNLIAHDHLVNDTLLFLRTSTTGPYAFLGFLKYVNHDAERERPVNFHWQILDFDRNMDYESLMRLRLQSSGETALADTPALAPEEAPGTLTLVQHSAPAARRGNGLPTYEFRAALVDYEARDRRRRGLGKTGERLVVEYEQRILAEHGRPDLASKVEPVCWTVGDGLGYDIRSFDKTGEEVHIEVKTTIGPADTPFYMSASEVQYAKTSAAKYRIYRLYNCTGRQNAVPFFVLENPFATNQLHLTPASYRVRLA